MGQKLVEVLKQPQYSPLSVAQQVSVLFAASKGVLNDVDNKQIAVFKQEWFPYFSAHHGELEAKLNRGDKLDEAEERKLVDALRKFRQTAFTDSNV